jgi:hypothetical protein
MRFIKGHVYECSFDYGDILVMFYGIYTHTERSIHKHFKYISNINYGDWHLDVFNLKAINGITFIDLGTVKQNPELFI